MTSLMVTILSGQPTQALANRISLVDSFRQVRNSCQEEIEISLPPDVKVEGSYRNIPNPFACQKTGDISCAGWKYIGRYEELLAGGTDPIFVWEKGNTLCLSVLRTQSSNVFQVHCFNTSNCSVCAFSSKTTLKKQTHIQELAQPNHLGNFASGDCSKCHATGPILLSKPLYEDLKDTTQALSKVCAANGGPKWGGSPPASWSQPDSSTIVRAPESCLRCHDNFVKRNTGGFNKGFCQILEVATEHPSGSMYDHSFFSNEEKKDFMGVMGCLPENFLIESNGKEGKSIPIVVRELHR